MEKRDDRQRVTVILAFVIIGAFSLAFIRSLVDKTYSMPGYMVPLVMVVCGWCFSGEAKRIKDGLFDRKDEEDGDTANQRSEA